MKILLVSLLSILQPIVTNLLLDEKPASTVICIVINGDQYCIYYDSNIQDPPAQINAENKIDFDHNQLTLSNLPKSFNTQVIMIGESKLNLKMDGEIKSCQLKSGRYKVENNQLIIPFKVVK